MNIELSPKERLTRITEILAEGVLNLVMGRPVAGLFEGLLRRFMAEWSRISSITVAPPVSSSSSESYTNGGRQ